MSLTGTAPTGTARLRLWASAGTLARMLYDSPFTRRYEALIERHAFGVLPLQLSWPVQALWPTARLLSTALSPGTFGEGAGTPTGCGARERISHALAIHALRASSQGRATRDGDVDAGGSVWAAQYGLLDVGSSVSAAQRRRLWVRGVGGSDSWLPSAAFDAASELPASEAGGEASYEAGGEAACQLVS